MRACRHCILIASGNFEIKLFNRTKISHFSSIEKELERERVNEQTEREGGWKGWTGESRHLSHDKKGTIVVGEGKKTVVPLP